jgi:hypothetical protein
MASLPTDRRVAETASSSADPFQRAAITGGERVLCLNRVGREAGVAAIRLHHTISYPADRTAHSLATAKCTWERKGKCSIPRRGKRCGLTISKTNIKTPMWGLPVTRLDGEKLIAWLADRAAR